MADQWDSQGGRRTAGSRGTHVECGRVCGGCLLAGKDAGVGVGFDNHCR